MKILILADPASTHIIKWVSSLAERGIQISLFGLNSYKSIQYDHPNINVFTLNLDDKIRFANEKSFSKLTYLKALRKIKNLITEINPDILHSHYASSYGFLGALTKFKPYLISVWGSDIQSFPYNSFFHRKILEFSLNRASVVLATSQFLADQSKKFTQKEILVTPFGVDTDEFDSFKIDKPFNEDDIVIGTVKSLEKTYGIHNLIKAFSIVKSRNEKLPLKLLIVGSGSQKDHLKNLAKKNDCENDCIFTGYINHELIRNYHNMIDISVFLSDQESFGVSVLEAMACCKPVVVSNTGGLLEIVNDGQNGYLVSPNNPEVAANAIEKLIKNPELRIEFGKNGREKVKAFYDWDKSVDLMSDIYAKTLATF
jgi:glycosyltransferase involved in cell wall biosynthesis